MCIVNDLNLVIFIPNQCKLSKVITYAHPHLPMYIFCMDKFEIQSKQKLMRISYI